MAANNLSDQAFCLVELRYTVQQLETQLAHLSETQRQTAQAIVDEMRRSEERFHSQYARAGRRPAPAGEGSFATMREATVRLLESIEGAWPAALHDLVHQQLDHDRAMVTEVANRRLT
jgi:hypothetical protein